MTKDTTFYNWIVGKADGLGGSSGGALIHDNETDSFFPRDTKADEHGFVTIVNYLYFNKGVWNRVLDAFMDAWQWYYREVTGTDWIDRSYNKWNYVKREGK